MAEWSQLPKELLGEIAKRLGTQSDILRFRSVCPTWRSSAAVNSRTFSSRFVTLPNDGISDTAWGFHLSRRTVFLVGPPQILNQTNPVSWLIKIEDFPEKMHLLHPLSRSQAIKLPNNFPQALDSSNFRVFELGQEFVLQYINYRPVHNMLSDGANLYMEKVVCKHSDSETNDFILLTIHVSGKLAIFKHGDKQWTIIQDMPLPYDDVILFKSNFYAVDSTGRTVIVTSTLNPTLIADPVFGGDKKILIESGGELLLVDMYLSIELKPDTGFEDEYQDQFHCVTERTVRFKVFRLCERMQKWDEVRDLGDRILFLSDDCTFSALVENLRVCEGNCIIFADNFFGTNGDEDDVVKDNDIGVFDLGKGSIAPLKNFPEYRKLFWPPPDWVTSTRMQVQQNQLEEPAV